MTSVFGNSGLLMTSTLSGEPHFTQHVDNQIDEHEGKNNPHNISKSTIGLDNVDNVSESTIISNANNNSTHLGTTTAEYLEVKKNIPSSGVKLDVKNLNIGGGGYTQINLLDGFNLPSLSMTSENDTGNVLIRNNKSGQNHKLDIGGLNVGDGLILTGKETTTDDFMLNVKGDVEVKKALVVPAISSAANSEIFINNNQAGHTSTQLRMKNTNANGQSVLCHKDETNTCMGIIYSENTTKEFVMRNEHNTGNHRISLGGSGLNNGVVMTGSKATTDFIFDVKGTIKAENFDGLGADPIHGNPDLELINQNATYTTTEFKIRNDQANGKAYLYLVDHNSNIFGSIHIDNAILDSLNIRNQVNNRIDIGGSAVGDGLILTGKETGTDDFVMHSRGDIKFKKAIRCPDNGNIVVDNDLNFVNETGQSVTDINLKNDHTSGRCIFKFIDHFDNDIGYMYSNNDDKSMYLLNPNSTNSYRMYIGSDANSGMILTGRENLSDDFHCDVKGDLSVKDKLNIGNGVYGNVDTINIYDSSTFKINNKSADTTTNLIIRQSNAGQTKKLSFMDDATEEAKIQTFGGNLLFETVSGDIDFKRNGANYVELNFNQIDLLKPARSYDTHQFKDITADGNHLHYKNTGINDSTAFTMDNDQGSTYGNVFKMNVSGQDTLHILDNSNILRISNNDATDNYRMIIGDPDTGGNDRGIEMMGTKQNSTFKANVHGEFRCISQGMQGSFHGMCEAVNTTPLLTNLITMGTYYKIKCTGFNTVTNYAITFTKDATDLNCEALVVAPMFNATGARHGVLKIMVILTLEVSDDNKEYQFMLFKNDAQLPYSSRKLRFKDTSPITLVYIDNAVLDNDVYEVRASCFDSDNKEVTVYEQHWCIEQI